MAVRRAYQREGARQRRALKRLQGEDVKEWGADQVQRPRTD